MSQATVVGLLAAHLALTLLPALAGGLVVARLGVRHVAVQLAAALATSGTLAMIAFWAYYLSHAAGVAVSWLELLVSAAAIVAAVRGDTLGRESLRGLLPPFALWALGTTFLVFLGFLHGVTSGPEVMAASRFVPGLPTDNQIPQFFTEWFYASGHHGTPPVFPGGWLASDRPPLQVGYALAQRPFGWDSLGVAYQVTTVALQQLWILGLWALLSAAGVRRHTRMIALVTVLLSDLAIQNGFYTWPKMLPAAMLLAAAALIATPLWNHEHRSPWSAVLLGTLVALASLGHGSSVFGIIPLVILALVRALPGWRWVLIALATVTVFSVPWSEYQKNGDPPGNRLTKWMLGGNPAIDDTGSWHAILEGYRQAGLEGTLHNKVENFDAMIGGEPMAQTAVLAVNDARADDWAGAVVTMRDLLFFYLFPSFGLLLIVPLLMALARWRGVAIDGREWRLALSCGFVLLVGSILWGLILFGSSISGTSIQSGSYLLPIAGLCGAAVGLRSAYPRFAIVFLAVSATLMLALYIPAVTVTPDTAYSPVAAVLSAAALAGFVAVATRAGSGVTPDDAITSPSRRKPLAAAD